MLPVDVVLVQVSLPDALGRHSLGLAREYLPVAIDRARVLVGETHPGVPWTHGGPYLQANDFDLLGEAAQPPLDAPRATAGPVEQAIAERVAGLIEDGATLRRPAGRGARRP